MSTRQLGSIYSSDRIRPYTVDSTFLRDSNILYNNSSPQAVGSKEYRITSNSTVYLPSPTTFFDCGGYNTLKSHISNRSSNIDVTCKYFFTPDNQNNEVEYLTKIIGATDDVIDNIPIKGNKYRIEFKNEDLNTNSRIYIDNTLSYFSQYNSTSHNNEVLNNPVNHNQRLNNDFVNDVCLNKHKNIKSKTIIGYIDNLNTNSQRLFWNTDADLLLPPTSYQLDVKSDDVLDTELKIKIDGIDGNGKQLIEYIELDGADATIPVTTSNLFLRVNSASAFITQPTTDFNYASNNGNISMYVTGSNFPASGYEYIDAVRCYSNTLKGAVPKGKQLLIKNISLNGVCGNYAPSLELYVNNNIINTALEGNNILKKSWTTRVQDNQQISQTFNNVNITINEFQEYFILVNPNGLPQQETYLTCMLDLIEYDINQNF
tara:strand:- start:1087 stop:2379 length:1293 start_codon:yes stop_codon:yes gene_type:complete